MELTSIVIIGAGDEGVSVYRVLRDIRNMKILGIADRNPNAPGMNLARRDNIYVTVDFAELVANTQVNVIIETTGSPELNQLIEKQKHKSARVIDASKGSLLISIIQSKVDERKLQSELWVILNAIQEGVAITDSSGIITYINPAFENMTGIASSQRVGNNIFEVSPNGALAQTLIKHKPVTGIRTKIENIEVMANAAPILVDGEVEGAVVICQPINDILKLMDDLQKSTTIIENLYARIDQMTGARFTFDNLVGMSKLFHSSVEMAKSAAKSNLPVLLVGEAGTGKNIFSQAIHRASAHRNKSFIKASSTALPEEWLESDLFGHEKGAFTGAVKTVLGKVELARGGTLYLEDITSFSPYIQNKLIRLLRDGIFERVGGTESYKANVRIIASTKTDIKEQIRKGYFNQELYQLLSDFEIVLPPLRQRREDVLPLAEHFISILNRKLGKQVTNIAADAVQLLVNYDWPGNVIQLENLLERAMVLVEEKTIERHHVMPYIPTEGNDSIGSITEIMPLDKMEQIMLKSALSHFGESLEGKKKAAQALNISLATLYNKLKKYKANI